MASSLPPSPSSANTAAAAETLKLTVHYHTHAIFFERGTAHATFPLHVNVSRPRLQQQLRRTTVTAKTIDARHCLSELLIELHKHAKPKGLSVPRSLDELVSRYNVLRCMDIGVPIAQLRYSPSATFAFHPGDHMLVMLQQQQLHVRLSVDAAPIPLNVRTDWRYAHTVVELLRQLFNEYGRVRYLAANYAVCLVSDAEFAGKTADWIAFGQQVCRAGSAASSNKQPLPPSAIRWCWADELYDRLYECETNEWRGAWLRKRYFNLMNEMYLTTQANDIVVVVNNHVDSHHTADDGAQQATAVKLRVKRNNGNTASASSSTGVMADTTTTTTHASATAVVTVNNSNLRYLSNYDAYCDVFECRQTLLQLYHDYSVDDKTFDANVRRLIANIGTETLTLHASRAAIDLYRSSAETSTATKCELDMLDKLYGSTVDWRTTAAAATTPASLPSLTYQLQVQPLDKQTRILDLMHNMQKLLTNGTRLRRVTKTAASAAVTTTTTPPSSQPISASLFELELSVPFRTFARHLFDVRLSRFRLFAPVRIANETMLPVCVCNGRLIFTRLETKTRTPAKRRSQLAKLSDTVALNALLHAKSRGASSPASDDRGVYQIKRTFDRAKLTKASASVGVNQSARGNAQCLRLRIDDYVYWCTDDSSCCSTVTKLRGRSQSRGRSVGSTSNFGGSLTSIATSASSSSASTNSSSTSAAATTTSQPQRWGRRLVNALSDPSANSNNTAASRGMFRYFAWHPRCVRVDSTLERMCEKQTRITVVTTILLRDQSSAMLAITGQGVRGLMQLLTANVDRSSGCGGGAREDAERCEILETRHIDDSGKAELLAIVEVKEQIAEAEGARVVDERIYEEIGLPRCDNIAGSCNAIAELDDLMLKLRTTGVLDTSRLSLAIGPPLEAKRQPAAIMALSPSSSSSSSSSSSPQRFIPPQPKRAAPGLTYVKRDNVTPVSDDGGGGSGNSNDRVDVEGDDEGESGGDSSPLLTVIKPFEPSFRTIKFDSQKSATMKQTSLERTTTSPSPTPTSLINTSETAITVKAEQASLSASSWSLSPTSPSSPPSLVPKICMHYRNLYYIDTLLRHETNDPLALFDRFQRSMRHCGLITVGPNGALTLNDTTTAVIGDEDALHLVNTLQRIFVRLQSVLNHLLFLGKFILYQKIVAIIT